MAERRVLVVDDDELLLRGYGRALGARAHLFVARTSAEARQIAHNERLDAIVVDHLLGDDDGIALLKQLRERHPACKLLLWSGYASTATTVAAMRAGADDVRSKPVMPQALLRWIDHGTWDSSGEAATTATLERMQWEYVRRVVGDCRGNVSEAARRLGIERATLRRHLQKRAPLR